VLEELGELFDRLSVDVEDAATAFAQSVRLMLQLSRSRPQISAVLVRDGMHYIESEGGVAPRLPSDIGRAGVASGGFLKAEPRLARAAVSGAVLATLQMSLANPELVDDAACDQLVGTVAAHAGRAVRCGARAGARSAAGRGAARTPLICETCRPTQAHSPPWGGCARRLVLHWTPPADELTVNFFDARPAR
jgi:hypothetical protein